jgi:hypothetical protein
MGNENDTYVNHDVFHFRLISEPNISEEIVESNVLFTEVALTTPKSPKKDESKAIPLTLNEEDAFIINLFKINPNAPYFDHLHAISVLNDFSTYPISYPYIKTANKNS